MGGAQLADGVWDLRLRLSFAGINRTALVRPAGGADPAVAESMPAVTGAGSVVVPYWTAGRPTLAIDVGQWGRPVAAVLAARTTVAVGPRRSVLVQVPIRSAASSVMPHVEVCFRPVEETSGGLIAVPAHVSRASEETLSAVATPKLTGVGAWRVWLAIADSATAPAVELPWLVRRSGRELVAERVSAAIDAPVTTAVP
jgi:hypothetical protein